MKSQIRVFNPEEDSIFEIFMNTDLDGPGVEMLARELMEDLTERIVRTIEQEVHEEDRNVMYKATVQQVRDFVWSIVDDYLCHSNTEAMQDARKAYKNYKEELDN